MLSLSPSIPPLYGSFYEGLAQHERDQLREIAITRRYQPGHQLVMENAPGSSGVMILLDGWAKATSITADEEEDAVLRIYGPGDLFGAEAALAGLPQSETVTTLARCAALMLPPRRFADLLSRRPGIAYAFGLAMLHRAQAADDQVRLRHGSADFRLARVLLDLARRVGTRAPDGLAIPVDLTQDDLARMLGLSRSTIARALNSLRQQGVIRTGYRAITITDVATLREIGAVR